MLYSKNDVRSCFRRACMFEKDLHISSLIDAYGALLTDRKRELLELYYNEDYSLSEISENTGISRQGVRDSLKKSEAELTELEEKLGLVKRVLVFDSFKSEFADMMVEACRLPYDEMRMKISELATVLREKSI